MKKNLLIFSSLFLLATALQAQPSQRQTVAITYLAAVDDAAVERLEDVVFAKTYRWYCNTPGIIACFISGPFEFPRKNNAARLTIAKNNFWVPFLFRELERSYGAGNVILDAMVAKVENGKLIFHSDMDDRVVDRRIAFTTWNDALLTRLGQPNTDTTRGGHVYYTVKQFTSDPNLTDSVDPQYFYDILSKPKVKLSEENAKGATWDKMLLDGPSVIPKQPAIKMVEKINAIPVNTTQPSCDKTYGSLLRLPGALPEDVCYKLRRAEVGFRVERSNSLFQYLTDSEYARSIKNMAISEKQSQSHENSAALMLLASGLGQTASGMSNGVPIAQISAQTMQQGVDLQAKLNIKSAEEVKVAAPLVSLQSSVGGAGISGVTSVSASTIKELREKLSDIGRRYMDVNSPR